MSFNGVVVGANMFIIKEREKVGVKITGVEEEEEEEEEEGARKVGRGKFINSYFGRELWAQARQYTNLHHNVQFRLYNIFGKKKKGQLSEG